MTVIIVARIVETEVWAKPHNVRVSHTCNGRGAYVNVVNSCTNFTDLQFTNLFSANVEPYSYMLNYKKLSTSHM